MFILIVEKQDL